MRTYVTACRTAMAARTTPACAARIVKAVPQLHRDAQARAQGRSRWSRRTSARAWSPCCRRTSTTRSSRARPRTGSTTRGRGAGRGSRAPGARELPQRQPELGQAVVARSIISARAREASRAAQQVSRKSAVSHRSTCRQARRLQLDQPRGQRAVHRRVRVRRWLGQAGRDRKTQAILPLKARSSTRSRPTTRSSSRTRSSRTSCPRSAAGWAMSSISASSATTRSSC